MEYYFMRKATKDWRYVVSLTIFISTCLYATWINCANTQPLSSETSCLLTVKAVNNWLKNSETADEVTKIVGGGARRLLGGLGSSPPRCKSKCGRCKPCNPVHVSVPPGTPVTAEYYPEAWRCKCGNKLYMP